LKIGAIPSPTSHHANAVGRSEGVAHGPP
jgi:hypothetical protein